MSRDFEMLVVGGGRGLPLILFPTSFGRYSQTKGFGLTDACAPFIDGPRSRFAYEPDARGIGTVRYPRVEPRDDDCGTKLTKPTLTNLYNERPAWLAHIHARLDAAVAAAYGFPADLSEEVILENCSL